MCVSVCKYVHTSPGALRSWRCQMSLELESQMVVSPLMWVLRMKPQPLQTQSVLSTTGPAL